MDKPPVMSMFATELDCLRAREKWFAERLSAAEQEVLEQCRLNGMGSEREAALLAKLEAAEQQRDEAVEALDKNWVQHQTVIAARKERDEAIAWGERMRTALSRVAQSHAWQCFGECRSFGVTIPLLNPSEADAAAKEALAVEAPAALASLRAQHRKEALLELADLMDRGAGVSAAGLRDLAEQEKQE